MGILATYRDFKNFEPTYNKWHEEEKLRNQKAQSIVVHKPITNDVLSEQKRAKIITNALTSIDEYAQTNAEDVDSVSQTLLYVAIGTFGAVGTFIGKSVSKLIKNRKIRRTIAPIIGTGLALAALMPAVKATVKNQVRANRISRFEGMHEKLFNTNDFAILTPEQEKQVEKEAKKIPDNTINSNNSIIKRADIFNSLAVFKDLTIKQSVFEYLKQKHNEQLHSDSKKLKNTKFSDEEIKQSKKDKKLFQKVLQNVDIKSHYQIERIEKAINVAYSSLFAGGVLEYLVSDGVLNLFKVKNKVIRPILSCALPVITIMSLNKQLANFSNDAIKSIRHKKMQEFVSNPNNFKECSNEEIQHAKNQPAKENKVSFFKFLKQTLKDIDDYKKYEESQRLKEKKFAIALKNIPLTNKQKADAELLKRNTEMTINTLDDQTQKYATTMETITESCTIPLDIMSPIIGTFIAQKLHHTLHPHKKCGLLFKSIGAIIAFLPAAVSEVYFVKEQRKAKRCAALIAINNLDDNKKFLSPSLKERKTKDIVDNWILNTPPSKAFKSFKQDLN